MDLFGECTCSGSVDDAETLRWRWPQANVTTYAALVRGLAASLRVSDALQTVADVRRRGVPSGDEVCDFCVRMSSTWKLVLDSSIEVFVR